MLNTRNDICIIDIEKEKGILEPPILVKDSPLSVWYYRIRDKHLSKLTDGDISRLIRQRLFLEYIIPEAIERLKKNPLAGEQYNGEIVESLFKVDKSMLKSNNALKKSLIELCNDISKNRKNLTKNSEWIYEEEAEEFFNKIVTLKEILDTAE